MSEPILQLLEERRSHLAHLRGGSLPSPVRGSGTPLSEAEALHLQEEGEALYWDDLEWENLTGEEALDGGALAELTFPGFLAFVRGLLLREVMPDSKAPADPRPEAVEALTRFLAGRVLELEAAGSGDEDREDRERARRDSALTKKLLDLSLLLLHGIGADGLGSPGDGASAPPTGTR